MSILYSKYVLGSLTLQNHLVMAPMTRNRAGPGNVPHALNATYYAQRASAGLITCSTCSRRAANISSASVSCVIGMCSRSSRSFSPSGVPPGSRVAVTRWPSVPAAASCST